MTVAGGPTSDGLCGAQRRNWCGIRLLQLIGVARAIKLVRFNSGTAWQIANCSR